jgi:hypothetical protein
MALRYRIVFAWMALAVAVPGASTLLAQSRYSDGRDVREDRLEVRRDYRDAAQDRSAIERLRAEVARDQWQLNEDARRGRRFAAAQDARELARDQRDVRNLMDVRQHDQVDLNRDRRDLRNDYRDRNGW